jgi:hypothetical protein
MVPYRPRDAIGGRSHDPLLGLFPRHRWHGQRENGAPPDACERVLVSGVRTPNPGQGASAPDRYGAAIVIHLVAAVIE